MSLYKIEPHKIYNLFFDTSLTEEINILKLITIYNVTQSQF